MGDDAGKAGPAISPATPPHSATSQTSRVTGCMVASRVLLPDSSGARQHLSRL
jgi:hypothetical protein